MTTQLLAPQAPEDFNLAETRLLAWHEAEHTRLVQIALRAEGMLRAALSGNPREVRRARRSLVEACRLCADNSGACHACEGEGTTISDDMDDGPKGRTVECSECDGRGLCRRCGGGQEVDVYAIVCPGCGGLTQVGSQDGIFSDEDDHERWLTCCDAVVDEAAARKQQERAQPEGV